MFELSQTNTPTTAPQGLLEANEKALLQKVKEAPVAALKELKQKWDTLVADKSPELPKAFLQNVSSAYQKFNTFYQGVMTVPQSQAELKAGQYRFLLSTYVGEYYDQKREHLKYIKPKPEPYDPATAPPVVKPEPAPVVAPPREKMPVGVIVGAGGFLALLLLWMAVRNR